MIGKRKWEGDDLMDIPQGYVTCELRVDDISADTEKVNRWVIDLQTEIQETDLVTIEPRRFDIDLSGTKGVDPVTAAIGFSMLSSSLPQILTFLRDWALRREGRVLKIKIQSKKDRFIEMEIPTAISKKEVKEWIETVQSAIK